MDVGALIAAYGYWAVALGCFFEGETILALAGFAASRGHLEFGWVVGIAALMGFAGDQFFYWLGRFHGRRVLERLPSVAGQATRVHELMLRFDAWLIVGVRFAYGLRIAGPILIGTSPISAVRFALFNALGALLWAPLVAGAGWIFGHAIEAMLGDLARYEAAIVLAGIALAALYALFYRWRRRRAGASFDPSRQ
ncbi:MAG TPA: DedA family protein [Burkholderiaceae bacterium]|nr:DedA family protein [Burkholderiaceae bacterium]